MSAKKSITISASLQVAIRFLTNLLNGEEILSQRGEKEQVLIPIPAWQNFLWFYSIAPSKITEKGQDFCTGSASNYKKLERHINFYGYKNTLVATIWLKGNQFTNSDKSKPTFWRVDKIKYCLNYDESRIHQGLDWHEAEFTIEQTPVQ